MLFSIWNRDAEGRAQRRYSPGADCKAVPLPMPETKEKAAAGELAINCLHVHEKSELPAHNVGVLWRD